MPINAVQSASNKQFRYTKLSKSRQNSTSKGQGHFGVKKFTKDIKNVENGVLCQPGYSHNKMSSNVSPREGEEQSLELANNLPRMSSPIGLEEWLVDR